MSTQKQDKSQPQDKRHPEQEDQRRRQRNALISRHVLHALGQPGDPHWVQVRQLWEDHYRVNVLVGADGVSARIPYSYFLVVDGDGAVLASTPAITKQY